VPLTHRDDHDRRTTMFRFPVLGLATLLSSTALWSAFVDHSMSIQTALIRFLIALPIATAMVMTFQHLMRPAARRAPGRRQVAEHEDIGA
jgi:hypothetical protein